MTQYSWTVIGAGPAGIAAVGRLLDNGIVGEQIAWIEARIRRGRVRHQMASCPEQHPRRVISRLLHHPSPSFRYGQAPAFELNNFDPEQTCPLGVVAEPLVWISQHLRQRVRTFGAITNRTGVSQ